MIRKIKLCLIDDEEAPLKLIQDYVKMIPGFQVEFSSTDPMLGLDFMIAGKADILVTDIVMPDLGGLEIIKRLTSLQIPVIICSGYTKFALEAFELNAVHFVDKPIKFSSLSQGLEKALFLLQKNPNIKEILKRGYVLFGEKGTHKRQLINLDEIEFVEQQGKQSYIFMINGDKSTVVGSFQSTLDQLKLPTLIRIHQSFAVNILKVKEFMPNECILRSGKSLPIGRIFRENLNDIINNRLIS